MIKNDELELEFKFEQYCEKLYTTIVWFYDHVTELGEDPIRWEILDGYLEGMICDQDIDKLIDLFEEDYKKLEKEVIKIVNEFIWTSLDYKVSITDLVDNKNFQSYMFSKLKYDYLTRQYGYEFTVDEESENETV